MKYALLLRKLVIEGISYYQVIDKIIGEETFDNKIEIISSKNNIGVEIDSITNNTSDELVYFEIEKKEYDKLINTDFPLFKILNDELLLVNNVLEKNTVLKVFYDKFKDFELANISSFLDKIELIRKKIKSKVIGQDIVIDKILTKLYNNQMFFDMDIDISDMKNNKSNILVMGPFGTGKTTIINTLMENLSDIPIIEYRLTGDYKSDVANIVKNLINEANGNFYLATRGIVVFDGISSLSSNNIQINDKTINGYLIELQDLLKEKNVTLVSGDGKIIKFDFSLITNICMIDIDYDFEEDAECDNHYSKILDDTLLELGITPELLIDSFSNEIIYMNEMDKDLALNILKNKTVSPLYRIKKMLEKQGKVVKISKDFIENLINHGLEYNEGFAGIMRTLQYVLEAKEITSKIVTFKKEDLDNYKIGTCLPSSDQEYESSKKDLKINEYLNVDMKKRTINGLTKREVVNLIKENIKGQDEHIFSVVNAFFENVFNRNKCYTKSQYREIKDNILMIGQTGTGKTAIFENLARILKVPYKRVDATSYSGTGIIGADVDTMFKDLVEVCSGDVKKAEQGIIFIDEIDKIASKFDRVDIGKDVQNALLTLIEGNTITLRPSPGETERPYTFDTSNVTFGLGGAFEGLDKIRDERIKKEKTGSSLGFKSNSLKVEINEGYTIDDLVKYGMLSQLIARASCVVNLNVLNEDILYDIVETSKDGYVNLKVKSYEWDGIKIEMSEGFKRSLARASYKDKKGARSIKVIFKKVIDEINKNIQDGEYEKVVLSDNSLDDYSSIQYVKKIK